MFGNLLNQIAQPVLGYNVAIKDNDGELLILPIAKYSFAVFSAFICLLIYHLSGVFFNMFSKTYR